MTAPSAFANSPVATQDAATGTSLDALMVFDGVCNFCSGYVRLVTFMDREGVISFTAIQSALGRELCRRCGVDPDDPSTFLFFDRGRPLEATDAMAAMMARLPWPWNALRMARLVPRSLRDAVYRWIVRNRYRLFGKRRTCMVPSSDVRRRFIDLPPSPE